MTPDTQKTLSRSSLAFLSGTFFSRLSGLGRDTAMAMAFGSNPAIAAFMVAYRFANLIRRLFGEGPLSSGFIPHFEQLRTLSKESGALFFRDLFFSLSVFLIFLIAGLEGVLWGVLKWGNLSPDNAQIIYLTQVMMPGIFFICLFGLSSGLLQCEKRFFLTGVSPVAFNGVWILAALWLKDQDPSIAMVPLSLCVIVAFFMQWAMLAPGTVHLLKESLSWKECFSPRLFPKELRQIIKPFLLGIIGVSALQVNSALDGIFARYASLEGPAYLWYAIRIEQLPLALFGIAMSAALLPPLARAIREGMQERYLQLLRFALRRSFSLIFPCTLAIFVLGIAGINLLYGHGDFSTEATCQTAMCLWGYGFGLLPSVFVLLLGPAFYADKDFASPMRGSLFSVIFHLLLTSLFVFVLEWGAFSIAIATSLSAWFNYFYLSSALSKKNREPLLDGAVYRSFLKTGGSALIASICTLCVGKFVIADPTWDLLSMNNNHTIIVRQISQQLLQFLSLGGTFTLVFFASAWVVNAEDVLEVIGFKRSS